MQVVFSVALPDQGQPIVSQEGLGNVFAEKVFMPIMPVTQESLFT